ncbi:MAG: lytic transglycosylase domain-containing protein [Oscillospiraceae bacterium]|nr:lytic transglycosylase domain-containing protein [Oscillospiraceae bacterium]
MLKTAYASHGTRPRKQLLRNAHIYMRGNVLARKFVVFTGVLVFALTAMGGTLANYYSDEQLAQLGRVFPQVHSDLITSRVMAEEPRIIVPVKEQPAPPEEPQPSVITEISAAAYEKADEEEEEDVQAAVTITPAIVTDPPRITEEFIYSEGIPLSYELQAFTYSLCAEHGISYETVLALMWRESRFNTGAVHTNRNGTKDSGIMQINDVNRDWLEKELGITDLMDPWQNITAGTTMLGRLTAKYGEHYALMAYQFGENGMRRLVEQGIVTSRHVQDVYEKKAQFESLFYT